MSRKTRATAEVGKPSNEKVLEYYCPPHFTEVQPRTKLIRPRRQKRVGLQAVHRHVHSVLTVGKSAKQQRCLEADTP